MVVNPVSSVTSQPAGLLVQPPLLLTSGVPRPGGKLQLQVPARAGHEYLLQYTTNLTSPGWVNLPSVPGTNGTLILSDPAAAGPQRFYRVQEQ